MTKPKEIRGALVTGAARRIGRSISLGLAEEGWHVIVHYHSSEKEALQTVAEIQGNGGKASAIYGDLKEPEAINDLIDESVQVSGGLGCLINNASMFVPDDIMTVNADTFDSIVAVNLRAPVLISQAFAKSLIAGTEGIIINLLDQKLVNPNPDFISYSLSKYALSGLTTMLAMALGPKIRVCAVAPGLILPSGDQTPEHFSLVHDRTPLRRGATKEDVPSAIKYLISAKSITGEVLLVDGGQHLIGSARDVMYTEEDYEFSLRKEEK